MGIDLLFYLALYQELLFISYHIIEDNITHQSWVAMLYTPEFVPDIHCDPGMVVNIINLIISSKVVMPKHLYVKIFIYHEFFPLNLFYYLFLQYN